MTIFEPFRRSDPSAQRLSLSGFTPTWMAGLAAGLGALAPSEAAAQDVSSSSPSIDLPTLTVANEGEGDPNNTLTATTGLSRLPGSIQDTPQTVNVVTPEIMQQQNVTTLQQALQNVPGVTASAGEGNGGMNGDQFRIRGFSASSDMYVDGLRDFGTYTRDAFATESVEVFKGSSSESFGMGTTGGVINQTQKTAHLGDKYIFDATLGMGPLYRFVGDINKQLNDTTAVRLVAMYHDQDVVDRDNVFSDRYGVLGSLGFGLGTDQTLTLNYLFQHGDRRPDMGVPMVNPIAAAGGSPGISSPVTEFGVDRSNFYGKVTDSDVTDVNMFTARYRKELNDHVTITNDTRIAGYTRYFSQTTAVCTGVSNPNALGYNCNSSFFAGLDPYYGFSGGSTAYDGPAGFQQNSWGGENITTALFKFNTGFLRHELIAGVDAFYQEADRTSLARGGPCAYPTASGCALLLPGTVNDPQFYNQPGFFIYENPYAQTSTSGSDFGVFVSDRVWLVPQLSVLAGVRYDNYTSTQQSTVTTTGAWNPEVSASNTVWSPKASVIWEPSKEQTYYLSYARSFNPPGMYVTAVLNPLSNATLQPEENNTYEAGAKLNLMNGKLGLTGALFQVDKDNAYQTDPTTGLMVETGEKQRVKGLELGVTGNLTPAWVLQFAYTYLTSEILSSATVDVIGNEVSFVPQNSFSLWTTYDIAPMIKGLGGKLLVGGGMFYTDGYWTNSANTSWIPESFSLNALVSYEKDNYRLALNGYNLTDEVNYEAGFGTRAVVGTGRYLSLSAGVTF